jgi:predicted MFS family arabinose efflux permease
MEKSYDPRIWLLAVGTFAVGTDNLVIAGILPTLAADLHVGLDAAGRLVTAYAFAYGLGSPILAALTGRLRRERVVIWAIGGFAVANLLCAVAPSYTILVLARIAAGLAAAAYTPGAYALAISLSSLERRGRALSVVLFGISTSTVLGVPLGTVIGHRLGWHFTFLFIAALSGVAMAALRLARMKTPDPSLGAATGVAARLKPLTRPVILLALLPNFIWGVGGMSVFTYIAPILGAHFDRDTIVALLLVNGLGGLLGGFIGGRVADRFGSARPMIVSFTVAAINFALWGLFFDGNLAATAVIVFIWALAGWSLGAPQQSRIVRLDPGSAGVTLAINNATFYLGSSIGAALGGMLLDYVAPIELTFFGTLAALVAMAALALSVLYGRRAKA